MRFSKGFKVGVSIRATSLYLQEVSEGRQGTVYTVIDCFEDEMRIERLTLKVQGEECPRYFGIPSELFELIER